MEGVKKFKTSSGAFKPPNIPKTPSNTINSMLEKRCGKEHMNVAKAGLAYYICGVFQAITTLYHTINPDKTRDSHTFWMIACGVISSVIVLKAYLLYNILMASAFIVHMLLYYGAIALGLFGAGLGVSGAIFYDKSEKSPSVSQRAAQYQSDISSKSE